MPSNAADVYGYLQAQGLPAGAAAGVGGNLDVESSFNPLAVGDNGTSHGIAQWHNERWSALVAWAKRLGRDPNALSTQEAYLVHEAQGMGPLWSQLRTTTDPSAAAALWQRLFERPANLDPTERAARARRLYSTGDLPGAAKGGAGGTPPPVGTPGAGGLNAQPVGLPGTDGWVDGLVGGLKRIAFTGAAGLFGLALVGFGVATAARKAGS